jgi:multidrug resistance efflux pump
MDRPEIHDLSNCTEFRLALLAKPPRLTHATAVLLLALVGGAVAWLCLTQANLVVRAPGRMRPLATPTKVFSPGRGKVLGAGAETRIIEVNFQEGDEVRRGDVLLRLDPERLDNELAKNRRVVLAAEEELARLALMDDLLKRQYQARKVKLEAELEEGRLAVANEKEGKVADIALAKVEVDLNRKNLDRVLRLRRAQATSEAEVTKARAELLSAEEKLAKARVAVNAGRLEVLRHALTVAEKEHQVKLAELVMKRSAKRAELDAARLDLTNLELERKQTVIQAPIDGVVIAGDLKPGDVVEPGKPVLEIAARSGLRFELAVPSDDVGKLRAGLPVRIKLDAFDYQKYGTLEGTVCYVAPDSTVVKGHAAPVYLVKVDVASQQVGRGDYQGRLRLGMAGQAEIITDRDNLLAVLVKSVRQSISID